MVNCNLKKNRNKRQCKIKKSSFGNRRNIGEGEFKIIIPKGDNSKNKIKVNNFKKYIDKINNNFGGSTIKPITLGCWIDPKRKGRLQCETGFAIEAWRDFDSDKKMKNFDRNKKETQLQKDKEFMKRIANEAAFEFGQASVPAVFDRVDSVDLMEGEWKQKIEKDKTGKKIKGNLFNKYI